MTAAIRITKQGFEIVDKGLELYTKVLDEVVPWKSIEETVKGLDRYRDNYSNEAADIIGEIKTLILNTTDKYFSAKQSIYEWCSLTIRFIATYKLLFDKHDEKNFPAQKTVLLKALDDGMEKMTAAHVKLEEISTSFKLVTGKLTTLIAQLDIDFDKKSEYFKAVNAKIRREAYGTAAVGAVLGPFGLILSYSIASGIVEGQVIPEIQRKVVEIKNFYENLKKQIEKANTDIKNAKSKLDTDIGTVGLESTQTEQTQAASEPLDMDRLHDDIIGTVNKLVVQCEEFKKRNN